MRDVFPFIERWLKEDKPFAIARVIRTWGSAPRQVGSAMLIRSDLQIAGSVSGGCIEGEVITAARKVLADHTPRQLDFGVEDELAWSVGLSCGGQISVWVEPFPLFAPQKAQVQLGHQLLQVLREATPSVWITSLNPKEQVSWLYFPENPSLSSNVPLPLQQAARLAYQQRESQIWEGPAGRYFLHVLPRRDRLVIVGAGHITIPLVQFAHLLDFEVIVIDPRKVFATPERFPDPPEQLLLEWPQEVLPTLALNEDTYCVLLTHDPKIDDPALHILLRSPVAYIGALGSRKTHQKRMARLRDAGFQEKEIARIAGPAGLEIQARTPEEIALSILAQIVLVRRSRTQAGPA